MFRFLGGLERCGHVGASRWLPMLSWKMLLFNMSVLRDGKVGPHSYGIVVIPHLFLLLVPGFRFPFAISAQSSAVVLFIRSAPHGCNIHGCLYVLLTVSGIFAFHCLGTISL
jgi:hypothetical protein